MPGPNRGALPLALLIAAALLGGIVVAVMRIDERGTDVGGGPGPTPTSPQATVASPTVESPSPTLEPTTEPTTEPTGSPKPTVEPTTEPTEEPSPEPTDDGNGIVLAQTGGPVLPYFLGGALMIVGSAGVWRLRRIFD
jgi:hypothetical protein